MRLVDISGQRFGRLIVVGQNGHKGDRIAWLCQCDCGNTIVTTAPQLKRGYVSSCGCYRREFLREKHRKHDKCGTSLYYKLGNMKKRCYDRTCDHYEWYGGKGITICDEWMGDDGYEKFFEWAMANGYKEGLTIDRIDNSKGYSPDNCRWITLKEQARNRTSNHFVTINGETRSISEWAEIYGVPASTIRARITKLGWDEEHAIKTPLLRKRREK